MQTNVLKAIEWAYACINVLTHFGYHVDVNGGHYGSSGETGFAVAPPGKSRFDAILVAKDLEEFSNFVNGVSTYLNVFRSLGVKPDPELVDEFKKVQTKTDEVVLLVRHRGIYMEVHTFPFHEDWEIEKFIEGFCFAAEYPPEEK
jgi:hypothetical protein